MKQLIQEGKRWDEIEHLINKLRRIDFKMYMDLSFKAFAKNPKVFHKNIQNILHLKKQSSLDIKTFIDEET